MKGRTAIMLVGLGLLVAGMLAGCGGSVRKDTNRHLSLSEACQTWVGADNAACSTGYADGRRPENQDVDSSANCEGFTGSTYGACVEGYKAAQGEKILFEPSDEAPEEDSAAGEAEPPEPIGGPLSNVGTITASDGEGTAFSESFKLGPLLYSREGTPSEAVLNACNVNYSSVIAQSVYARGEASITYEEGSLTTELNVFETGQEDGENHEAGLTAFKINGVWECGASIESTNADLDFEPGETKTFPIWVLAAVLSNAEPKVSEAKLDTWSIKGPDVVGGEVEMRGPGAVSCPEEEGRHYDRLLLFGRPPVQLPLLGGKWVTCRAA